jgi:hypothetical protein
MIASDKITIFALSKIKIENMLKGIIAISGQPGLFKVLSEGKNSVIVESLLSGKRSTVYTDAKMSALEDIAIYTTLEDLPLRKVFRKISDKESGGKAIDVKNSPEQLKKYFAEVLPDYNKEKVYFSDIKKVISWYNLLQEKGLLNLDEEDNEETEGKEKESAPEVEN